MARATPLEAEIRRLIGIAGPMPVWQYMGLCLQHPQYGYYVTRDPLGARGDFITAPEISQMFGELLGVWAAAVWQQMGSPAAVRLIELGPGRGTLLADAVRAAHIMPAFRKALSVHLVETSPVLRERQQQTLAGIDVPTRWHAALAEVPDGPLILIANEFFDALPVHQCVRQKDGWHERLVGADAAGNLLFTLAPEPIAHFEGVLPPKLRAAPLGAIFEWRNDHVAFELGRRLVRNQGAALVIDYGHTQSAAGDTLQAVGEHAFANPLGSPGQLDLTAHVDFEALAVAAESIGARSHGPVTQAEFLRALGIHSRASTLKANGRPDQVASIESAVARLTGEGPKGMGRLFKVIGFSHPKLGPLPAMGSG
jgi:SAM-dependent MidA family methyltransferase